MSKLENVLLTPTEMEAACHFPDIPLIMIHGFYAAHPFDKWRLYMLLQQCRESGSNMTFCPRPSTPASPLMDFFHFRDSRFGRISRLALMKLKDRMEVVVEEHVLPKICQCEVEIKRTVDSDVDSATLTTSERIQLMSFNISKSMEWNCKQPDNTMLILTASGFCGAFKPFDFHILQNGSKEAAITGSCNRMEFQNASIELLFRTCDGASFSCEDVTLCIGKIDAAFRNAPAMYRMRNCFEFTGKLVKSTFGTVVSKMLRSIFVGITQVVEN